ncbi:MAG: adenylyltransferase/cytidyltransferase family protein [Lachnospiraceae bacterium]|nr:adenylyltransferase/cytidyltransferase family protein [Lachnospiraceae bacterium]
MADIISKQEFKENIRLSLKAEGKTIALCHGVFDLVHPGHIIHLEQAKAMADVLVVSITAAKFVRKGPGRPYFNDEMRLKFLSAIEYIDYVMISDGHTVDDIVESVEPDIYVKGEEYAKESEDVTGKIREERELVEKHGGQIRYTTGDVFSSTKLINTAMSGLPEDVIQFMEAFKQKYSMKDIKEATAKIEDLKVLVVGDVIIDKYSYCNVQGLMSKDMGYSTRLKYSEEYYGGSLAITRHISSFCNNVTLMSIIGNERHILEDLQDNLPDNIELQLHRSEVFPTIVKHRYLTKNTKREEYRKIFAVNNIPCQMEYEKEVKESFQEQLKIVLKDYDVVFLCDFGHGLIDEKTQQIIEENAKYLVLNCQTNSTNHGMNIITKYNRADAFTLDQKELQLAYPMFVFDEHEALKSLSDKLGGSGWLTRGAKGALGIQNQEIQECPAFTLTVKDTIGAGDAFFAVAGLYVASGQKNDMGLVMGNIAGALGANIVGNKDRIEKVNVLKYASTLMNV